MVLCIFSDGSFTEGRVPRAYFVFYHDHKYGDGGPYVFRDIASAVYTAREHLAKGDRVRLELQRTAIEDGGEQVVIWKSPPPTPIRRERAIG